LQYNDDIFSEEDDASSWDSLKTEDEEEPTSTQVEILKGKSIQEIVLFLTKYCCILHGALK